VKSYVAAGLKAMRDWLAKHPLRKRLAAAPSSGSTP